MRATAQRRASSPEPRQWRRDLGHVATVALWRRCERFAARQSGMTLSGAAMRRTEWRAVATGLQEGSIGTPLSGAGRAEGGFGSFPAIFAIRGAKAWSA